MRLVILMVVLLTAMQLSYGSEPAFKDFFPVGVWYFWEDDASYINRHVDDPKQARQYYERTIGELADHGINLIIANWTPKDHRKMVLDIAQEHSVKVIVHLDEVNAVVGKGEAGDKEDLLGIASRAVENLKKHPAVAGYYIIDEPSNSPDMAKRIAQAKQVLETVDPKHPAFSCLLGGYEDLLKTVDYHVLLIDIYPLGTSWSGDFSGYISELERGSRNAGDRPLWVILQAFGKPNAWKVPTPEEIRAEVWLALAHGAKGIVYFLYQSTTGYQSEWLQGMVDMDLKQPDGRLEEIGKINADLHKLAPTLLNLKPAEFEIPFASDMIIAKGFVDDKGARYVILANKDTRITATGRWTGDPPTDVLTGLRIRPLVILKPGAGRLLRLK